MLSIVTMLVSLAALTFAMVGAVRLVLDIFDDGFTTSLNGILVKVIVLGLAFFFGWGCGLACVRVFGNLVYPIIINVYANAGPHWHSFTATDLDRWYVQ